MKNWFSVYGISVLVTLCIVLIAILENNGITQLNIISYITRNGILVKDFYNMLVGGYFAILSIILAIFGFFVAIKDQIEEIHQQDENLVDRVYSKFKLILPTIVVIGSIIFLGDVYVSFLSKLDPQNGNFIDIGNKTLFILTIIPIVYLIFILDSLRYILGIFGSLMNVKLSTKIINHKKIF